MQPVAEKQRDRYRPLTGTARLQRRQRLQIVEQRADLRVDLVEIGSRREQQHIVPTASCIAAGRPGSRGSVLRQVTFTPPPIACATLLLSEQDRVPTTMAGVPTSPREARSAATDRQSLSPGAPGIGAGREILQHGGHPAGTHAAGRGHRSAQHEHGAEGQRDAQDAAAPATSPEDTPGKLTDFADRRACHGWMFPPRNVVSTM